MLIYILLLFFICFLFVFIAPVFYSEKARTRWGRKAKIGGLVVRDVGTDNTYNNSRRKLLTSLGHPNVFNNK